jgi:aryl-alcohol dehydrogenase-like predicted oxidoreductase
VDSGVTFLDTADVYGDGRSETLIGRFLGERADVPLTVATKMGRRAQPHVAEAYTLEAFRGWVDRSRRNLRMDTLDLVQLHCPPTEVVRSGAVYDALDVLVAEGAVRGYGVSVETVEEALAAIERPHLVSVQLVLNIFRRKPLETVLPAAAASGVAVIARVPLASGLLSGRYDESTTFPPDDHRSYNRHGEAFDVGETFSGVPYDVGVDAAREVAAHAPEGVSPARLALRWVIDQPGVTAVIPGAKSAEQARDNASADELSPLSARVQAELERIYDERIREHVHHRW